MNKKFYLGSDHAGFELKDQIKNYLIDKGYEVVDLGTNDSDHSVSYVDYGKKLAQNVLKDNNCYGIGVCGTGIGISLSVNRFKGIRGARITSEEDAKLAKEHNNANVLLFGGRQINIGEAKKMIDTFLETDFKGGRHLKRIEDLDK